MHFQYQSPGEKHHLDSGVVRHTTQPPPAGLAVAGPSGKINRTSTAELCSGHKTSTWSPAVPNLAHSTLTTLTTTGNSHFALGGTFQDTRQIPTTHSWYLQHISLAMPYLSPWSRMDLWTEHSECRFFFPFQKSSRCLWDESALWSEAVWKLIISLCSSDIVKDVPDEPPPPSMLSLVISESQNTLTNNQVLRTITHNSPVQLTCSPAHPLNLSELLVRGFFYFCFYFYFFLDENSWCQTDSFSAFSTWPGLMCWLTACHSTTGLFCSLVSNLKDGNSVQVPRLQTRNLMAPFLVLFSLGYFCL